MYFKKFISVLMVCVLAFGVFAICPSAEDVTIAVKTDRDTYLQGETVTATVYFPSDCNLVASLDFSLVYDATKLEIVSVTSSDDLTRALNEQTNGKVFSEGHSIPGFIKWSLAGSNNFNFRGTFAVVEFAVKKSVPSSTSVLKVRVDNASNSGYVNMTSSITGGTATINFVAVAENELTYILNEDGKSYKVNGYSCISSESVTIPATFAGYPVTAIADGVFSGHSELKKIVLPDTIDSIGKDAFLNCDKLEEINLSVGMTEIKAYTFSGCTSLKNIEIPFTVTSIGEKAFLNCQNLEKVKIAKNTAKISADAFKGCNNVTFNITEGNTVIPAYISKNLTTAKTNLIKDITLGTATAAKKKIQYTGKALTPAVTVTLNSEVEISEGTDYKVVYRNNVNCGKATIYVAGVGMDNFGEGYIINFDIYCNHNYEKKLVERASCTKAGYYLLTCKICGHTESEVIPQLAHQESDWIVDALPTITTEGSEHTVCSSCDAIVQTRAIAKSFPDLNGDGFINSADALIVLLYSVEKENKLTTTELFRNADTDGNGAVNSFDALTILQIGIGQIKIDGYTA